MAKDAWPVKVRIPLRDEKVKLLETKMPNPTLKLIDTWIRKPDAVDRKNGCDIKVVAHFQLKQFPASAGKAWLQAETSIDNSTFAPLKFLVRDRPLIKNSTK